MTPEEYEWAEALDARQKSLDLDSLSLHMIANNFNCVHYKGNEAGFTYGRQNIGVLVTEEMDSFMFSPARFVLSKADYLDGKVRFMLPGEVPEVERGFRISTEKVASSSLMIYALGFAQGVRENNRFDIDAYYAAKERMKRLYKLVTLRKLKFPIP